MIQRHDRTAGRVLAPGAILTRCGAMGVIVVTGEMAGMGAVAATDATGAIGLMGAVVVTSATDPMGGTR